MSGWISNVKNVAFHLEAAGLSLVDEDDILALTTELSEKYSTFIVALDSSLPDDLTLLIVVTQLLNEEICHHPKLVAKSESECYEGCKGVMLPTW